MDEVDGSVYKVWYPIEGEASGAEQGPSAANQRVAYVLHERHFLHASSQLH
jgi:hypothetical protein